MEVGLVLRDFGGEQRQVWDGDRAYGVRDQAEGGLRGETVWGGARAFELGRME